MPIINYVREHMRFIEYASDEGLSGPQRLLWYALMHIFNQRAQGRVWPDEFIRISNDRLLTYCPMQYDTLAAARNALKQRGLIDFEPGQKNKKAPAYRMIYFFPQYAPPETDEDTGYPEKSDNIRGNIGGNFGGNLGGNIGDYRINNTERDTQESPEEEEEEEDSPPAARARGGPEQELAVRVEIQRAWRAHFGATPSPAVTARLEQAAAAAALDGDALALAIQIAALKNAADPVSYILHTLGDWQRIRIHTRAEAEEYVALREMARPDQQGYQWAERQLDEFIAQRREKT